MHIDDQKLIQVGLAVLEIEARAILSMAENVKGDFAKACRYLLKCSGRIVVTGMGKSGHIGKKIAATFASTGTPAFFMHAGEASHGDLGMITAHDVLLALSNSGETDEILRILPLLKRRGIPLIALSAPNSTLARNAEVHLDVSVHQEADPLGLAPTASTTAALAMGDALAMALLEARGFTAEDFALSHPGGRLGRRLLVRIEDVMHQGTDIPMVSSDATLSEALVEMTKKRLGMTTVVGDIETRNLLGIFTDGDLRRALDDRLHLHSTRIEQIMTKGCKTVTANVLATEALHLMERHRINALPVLDKDDKLIGALNVHDLLRAGVL